MKKTLRTKFNLMNEKEKAEIRKPILKEFEKLSQKYGTDKVRYSFNWWNARQAAKKTREKQIKILEKELETIKKGKIPYSY